RQHARMSDRRAAAHAQRNAAHGLALADANHADISMAMLSKLPTGWNNHIVANDGEVRFRAESTAGIPSQGTLSVIARSRPNPAYLTQREQRTMLAGVSFSDLRRIAIDKMINAGGWVINDYERQVNGARVFVVIAQTPSDGRSPEKSWNFYFAEVDGKIYSLTLNTPVEFSDKLTVEGEKFISSLNARTSGNPQPGNK